MIDVNRLLDLIVEKDASDIHMVVGEYPTMRHNGRLVPLQEFGVLTPDVTDGIVKVIAPERNQQELQEICGSDFGFSYGKKARFRVSIYKQKGSTAINMRLIPYRLLSFEDIGLPTQVQELLYRPRGLFLVTGPTGSGKTTTLATMIDYINQMRDCHIITIEDPIEYYHGPKKSVISQREVHVDVPTFSDGIIRALRQDPDVILVGEMRDLSTIQAAITAAETGHLVFSTLHTTGAARTVDRITDVFPQDQQEQVRIQLSSNLICVISQLLLPKPDGKGRAAAFEIMVSTSAISHHIREKKTYAINSDIQTGTQLGMKSLDASLFDLYKEGKISEEEMFNNANKPEEIKEKMGLVTATKDIRSKMDDPLKPVGVG
ncbi:MAG: type IV pilus twitching motility protein PilT [Armatimonadetes bacterium]|nr:type IV pilus twitching motility protein PilT [Armatimonadota bacterium]